ncbi:MAG: DUF1559 domain-containing protein [Planctomycetia bacterium]|jgi:hypothetical protein
MKNPTDDKKTDCPTESSGAADRPKSPDSPKKSKCCTGCLAALFLLGVLFLLMLPAIQAARETANRSFCNGTMKGIGLGLQNYHHEYGQFPPAYTVDASGRRLHSWRTLILPFIVQNEIYDKLRLDEPWDSPHNLAVFKEIDVSAPSLFEMITDNTPSLVYQCPSCPWGHDKSYTSYAMVIGPNCVSDGPTSCSREDLANDCSSTLLVVETTAPIRWYEPKDIDIKTLDRETSDDEPTIDSFHPGMALSVFADGSIQGIKKDMDKEVLRAKIEGRVKNPKSKVSLD